MEKLAPGLKAHRLWEGKVVIMNEKLREQLSVLFEEAPKTRKALELKEELLSNAEERYMDLINDGISQEDATKNVIKSIGNVAELFQGLEEPVEEKIVNDFKIKKKIAVYVTIATGMYFFGLIIFLFFVMVNTYQSYWYQGVDPFNYVWLGAMVMLLIYIIPTCMLVYVYSLYPKYVRTNDTIVEEFKEWKVKSTKNKSIKTSVSLILWSFTLIIYFGVSFISMAWYITWILFLVAICIQFVIMLVFQLKENKG